MVENNPNSGSAPRRIDPRYAIDLAARLVVVEGKPEPVRLINLSRHGFRVAVPLVLPAGQPVRLEVDGWPRLVGRVVWCDGGRIGCMVDVPPSEAVYAMMCASTQGPETTD
ncbi:PilZ domain-containing protein [Sphingomonas sp. CGMCC 1.13654]|uniref:PilZ domain-containing protein n=2 Tax=Sphingomonas chungangi TaxID=2683589 RepID=A0A838L778_9SPHN|nr:PilZ domain-containing protein [Sphingomonas chungangi]